MLQKSINVNEINFLNDSDRVYNALDASENQLKFIKDNKGLKKCSEIAKNFEGRTENALKNRYTLII